MRFLILGATSPSGILVVRKTLEVYPDASIVIFARSPNKLPEDLQKHAAITIIQGTLDELDKAETAVEGIDVVLSTLGPAGGTPLPNTPVAKFYEQFIPLLYKHNVKRFICLSTPSFTDPNDQSSWKFSALVRVVYTVFYNAYAEMVAMGEVTKNTGKDLDWTIVRVPFLTNGESEGVVAGYVGDGKTGMFLTRKAYAAFVVGEVEKREWVKKAPLISTP